MSGRIDDLAKLAQKYIAEVPVVVLGSGASVPHGFPTMDSLAQELRTKLNTEGDELAAWKSVLEKLEKGAGLESALSKDYIPPDLLFKIANITQNCIRLVDERIYRNLIETNLELPLSKLFSILLKTCKKKICVVTTNYDRLAEYAASTAKASYFTGFSQGPLGIFCSPGLSISSDVYFPEQVGVIKIWKVHGSIDWFIAPNSMKAQSFHLHSGLEPIRPLVVTPGTIKYQMATQEPLRSIIAKADEYLTNANAYLCIGYGFNDDHVQPRLLERHRDEGKPLILITKELTPKAREIFISEQMNNILLIEENPKGGTRIYCHLFPDGAEMVDYKLWTIDGFLGLLNGDVNRARI